MGLTMRFPLPFGASIHITSHDMTMEEKGGGDH